MKIKRTAEHSPSQYKAPINYQKVAEEVLGYIDWETPTKGHCACPGIQLHTKPNGKHDCRVYVGDGRAHTITCFHDNCQSKVDEANRELRSRLGTQENKVEGNYPKINGVTIITNPLVDFLTYCFKPSEYPSIESCRRNADGHVIPMGSGQNIYTRDDLVRMEVVPEEKSVSSWNNDDLGMYCRINPVAKGSSGKDADVTNFRYTLIECDTLNKREQEKLLRESGLPIGALIDSGGKSIHAWVHVDAKDIEEYHHRRQKIWEALPKGLEIDTSCKNPSRFSRLPGVTREGKPQSLLDLGIGPESYEAWETIQELQSEDPPLTPHDLFNINPKEDPGALLGRNRWLCRGMIAQMAGESGIGKSTFNMQAMITWGLGKPLFGIAPKKPINSYLIQFENCQYDLAEQFQGTVKSLELSKVEIEMLQPRIRAHRILRHVGLDFIPYLGKILESNEIDILWIDPMSCYFGDDMVDQKAMVRWLYHGLIPLAKKHDVVIILSHHTTKPPSEKKAFTQASTDYAGFGSSIQANAVRATIGLTEIPSEGDDRIFRFSLGKRGTRAGLRNFEGEYATHLYVKYSRDDIHWVACPKPQPPEKGKK